MSGLHEMLRKINSSPHHNRMQRFAAPLKECFSINHFWYYRITDSGLYSYMGTHTAWDEFCIDNALSSLFPCLRHPNIVQPGIQLMKTEGDPKYQEMLQTAWSKFKVNFNINLLSKIPDGIEAFGFATCFNDAKAEERLLNDLPTLSRFIKIFREEQPELFLLLENNQVDLSSQFGMVFYEQPKAISFSRKHEVFLQKIGLGPVLTLTPREVDILKFVSNGYPASYIAKQLHLSIRTVENYLAVVKDKLSCRSKVELIQKAQEIASIGYFDH